MTKLIVARHNFTNAAKNQRRKIFTLDCSEETDVFAEEITVSLETCEWTIEKCVTVDTKVNVVYAMLYLP